MPSISNQSSFEELIADSRLVGLCDLQRTGDEVLDVITLNENQHSDILAWLLDAREGHGQGDAILRDFLIFCSTVAGSSESGLDRRGSTSRFFKKWPPSRVQTTSFGSAFIARELGMIASERVDLFVIDPQNSFILLIENKALSSHSEGQLERYRTSFSTVVAANPRLRKYHQVYVALDRKFDGQDTAGRPSADSWLHIGYNWLKTSATRAHMHVSRGNAAARLVVSYCNRQTDWENPDNEKSLRLAVDLHQSYPEAIKTLLSVSRGRLERQWLEARGQGGPALLFLLQNKSAINLLKETQGMATLKSTILAKLPNLPKQNVSYKKAWLDLCPSGWEQFKGDVWWPVFLSVRYSDDAQSKYRLFLCWNAHNARSLAEAESLRQCLALVEGAFKKFPGKWRRVQVGTGLTQAELLKVLSVYESKLLNAHERTSPE